MIVQIIRLAEVRLFVQCNVENDSGEKSSWMAAISWYIPHHCSVWFGKPTQMWTTTQYSGYCFIPVSYIKSRVVYTLPQYSVCYCSIGYVIAYYILS